MEGRADGLKNGFSFLENLSKITYHCFNEKLKPIRLHAFLDDLITIKGVDLIRAVAIKEGLDPDRILFSELYDKTEQKVEEFEGNQIIMSGAEVFLVFDQSGKILPRSEEFTEVPPELEGDSLAEILKESKDYHVLMEKIVEGGYLSQPELKEVTKFVAQRLQNFVFTRPANRTERSAWLKHLFIPYPKFDMRQLLFRTGPHPHKFDAFLFNTFFNAKTKRRRIFKKFSETGEGIPQ
ncbi:unnamed protein product [Bursaphelenchus xylophilus]|uniref:(pine wood nematode) hypothetical protein n=1 Tax=Bursaphelenchus xylophilus TaxID=6326 RepID=A0A1I7RW14_BURXY|nr:unnamed protein product [Bursaphelenchus xylophilus]CAG9095002.1 unnamed protein product [Bursaphelenchus xylophilus]